MMAVKNKYKVERKYITNRKARSRSKLNGPRFLVAHETANNNAGADGHYNYFQGITFQASAHTFIDDKKILEIIPTNEKAWHVQYNNDRRTLGLGYANDNAVGTELCRPGNFNEAYDRYVWYHAYLCKKFGLQPRKHIVAHKTLDPQRRRDPQSWLEPNGVSWSKFINDVQAYYDKWESDSVKIKDAPKSQVKSTTSTKKSVSQMADEVIDGKHGSGHANRRKSLGISQAEYEKVRAEVNRRAGVSTSTTVSKPKSKSIAQMATEVIAGKHGSGHANRKRSLGISQSEYEKVRAEVNRRATGGSVRRGKSISQMATEVIQGKHGSGHEARRKSLGISKSEYEKVRAEVNRRM